MKKIFLLAILPLAITACGGDKEGDDKEGGDKKAALDECECLHASMADRSKECTQWRQTVINEIKADLGDNADDLDAIDAELEKLKAECE